MWVFSIALPSLAGIASSGGKRAAVAGVEWKYLIKKKGKRKKVQGKVKNGHKVWSTLRFSGRPAFLFRSSRPGNGGAVTGKKEKKRERKEKKKERIMETVASLGPRENPIQHNCRSGIISRVRVCQWVKTENPPTPGRPRRMSASGRRHTVSTESTYILC
jgi:hypothetical protein